MKDNSLQPVHCNSLDDLPAALKSGAKMIEIPDELLEAANKKADEMAQKGWGDPVGEKGVLGTIYDNERD